MSLDLVRLILVVIFVCVGTVGNILSIITVSNKHCKKSSYTVYLAGLAIADLLALYNIVLTYSYEDSLGINLKASSALYCKLHFFLTGVFSGVSIWLVVVLALERTFVVYFPFKARSFCKPKNAFIVTALLVAFFVSFNSHYVYGMRIQSGHMISADGDSLNPSFDSNASSNINVSLPPLTESISESFNNGEGATTDGILRVDETTSLLPINILQDKIARTNRNEKDSLTESRDLNHTESTPILRNQYNDDNNLITNFCGFVGESYTNFYRSWAMVENIFYFFLPVSSIVTANIATWTKVNRSSSKSLTSVAALTLRRTRHVLILTSLISVGFVVFITPITVIYLVEAYLAEDFTYPINNKETWAVIELIGRSLYLGNHSFNFFMYILSGKRFRESLKAAFCKSASQKLLELQSISNLRNREESGVESYSKTLSYQITD